MWPRKYLETTTLVASWDQLLGISTSVCSKTTSPFSFLIWAERSSHSTASNGSSPGRVKKRGRARPLARRLGFLSLPTARSSVRPLTPPVSIARTPLVFVPAVPFDPLRRGPPRIRLAPCPLAASRRWRGFVQRRSDTSDQLLWRGADPFRPVLCSPDRPRWGASDNLEPTRPAISSEPPDQSTGDERGPGTSGAP